MDVVEDLKVKIEKRKFKAVEKSVLSKMKEHNALIDQGYVYEIPK